VPRSAMQTAGRASGPTRDGIAALAGDLASALDPVALANRVTIEPDPWQARALRSNANRILMNCCRQSGKSTVAALLALHAAIYNPGSLTLLLSPSQRQSTELFRVVLGMYRYLDRPVQPEAENQMSLALANGSRVVSLPGNESTIRGYSGTKLLIVDEAAQVTDSLYKSVRPMLAVSGGRLLALSTPFGSSGWWYDAWHDARQPWERYLITAHECPRISPAFLADEERTMGEWWFRQEYLCEFMSDEFALFDPNDLAQLVTEEQPWPC
jgi:hypothetical protein